MALPPRNRPFRRLRLSERERQDEADRQTRSLAGLAFSLLLLLVGLYLVEKLAASSQLEDCVLSGRTNCEPIDPRSLER